MTTNYEKYPHYFKRIPEGMTHLDVYAVLQLFGVTDQATGHAIKKLLVPGVRGTKSKAQDIQEAIDTLERWKQLNKEFEPKTSIEKHSTPRAKTAVASSVIKTKHPSTSLGCGGNCSSCKCDGRYELAA